MVGEKQSWTLTVHGLQGKREPILKCRWGGEKDVNALQELLHEILHVYERYCVYFYSTPECCYTTLDW